MSGYTKNERLYLRLAELLCEKGETSKARDILDQGFQQTNNPQIAEALYKVESQSIPDIEQYTYKDMLKPGAIELGEKEQQDIMTLIALSISGAYEHFHQDGDEITRRMMLTKDMDGNDCWIMLSCYLQMSMPFIGARDYIWQTYPELGDPTTDMLNVSKSQIEKVIHSCYPEVNSDLLLSCEYASGRIEHSDDQIKIQYYLGDPGPNRKTVIYATYPVDERSMDVFCSVFDDADAGQKLYGIYCVRIKKDEQSLFGYSTIAISRMDERENFVCALASSTLMGKYSYAATNVFDGKEDTAWSEGVQGDGIGEWIMVLADEPQLCMGFEFTGTYNKSLDTYYNNGQIERIRVETDDGLIKEYKLASRGIDGYSPHLVYFDHPIQTKSIKITILEVSPGAKYQDTCVSEIKVF